MTTIDKTTHLGTFPSQDVRDFTSQIALPTAPGVATVANRLLEILRSTAPDEHRALFAEATLVELPRDFILYSPGQPISNVYFPVGCAASLVCVLRDGQRIEVGTAGLEGMLGVPVMQGVDSSPLECVIQIPGAAYRVSVKALRAAGTPGSVLGRLLQHYAQYLSDQAAQAVACTRVHELGQRCALWLLMTHDRVAGDRFERTQHYLAIMLGVHRPAVTLAAGVLQDAGFIRYSRGRIIITDRIGLQGAACECYETDRRALDRLLPFPARGA